jgi:poly(ribitol-phosphate) beta-N-acetylglucosaminyltransferase
MKNEGPPAISVIIIVRNNEELLPRAIDSVLKQTFDQFELIIVNDGSTDGTRPVIDRYSERDNRIKPKHLGRNVGRSMARNTGLDLASGKYIFFLDSDDFLPEISLFDLFQIAEKKNADIVYGGTRAFDRETGKWRDFYYTDRIIDSERHNFRLTDHTELVDNHQVVGRLFSRDFLRRNNIRFSTVRRNAEDVLFAFYSAFYARKLSMAPQKTVYFYSFGNQFENVDEAQIFDARDNVLETIAFTLRSGDEPLRKRMLQKGIVFAGNLYRAQKVYENDEKKFNAYLQSLLPFVRNITDDVLVSLPGFFQYFARALQAGDMEQASFLWSQKYMQYQQFQEIEKLRSVNEKLAAHIEELHNSRSWHITTPLRKIALQLRRMRNNLFKSLSK